MPQLRVLLGFTDAPDHRIDEIAGSVLDNLYGNAAYPTPPVTAETLGAARDAFEAAIAAQSQGGTAATAEKNNKRDALITLLRQLAGYVQENHGNDLARLLSSGFEAVSTNNTSSPLPAPEIRDLLNAGAGKLTVRVAAVKNARAYEVRLALVDGAGAPAPWQPGGLFTNSRAMPLEGLTPGALYHFQVRAIGGSTGTSDWSDTRSHRSL